MHDYRHRFILKIIICAVALIIFNTYGFAYLFGNGSGDGYCDTNQGSGCVGETAAQGGAGIESYVAKGGGYFLGAYAKTLLLLNRVEMSDLKGFDYVEAAGIAGEARQNTGFAGAVYSVLIELAENTPYNPEVTAKLKSFNYNAFARAEGLNRAIVKEVAAYLAHGNITGLYKHIEREISTIEAGLTEIHGDILSGSMPGLSQLWQVNEAFSVTLLFGQYTARVFDAVKKEKMAR